MSTVANLIVDVQNDFCPGGALPVKDADRIIPVANRLIRLAWKTGTKNIYSRDWHPERTTHFNTDDGPWPPHCVMDTKGADFHPELIVPTPGTWGRHDDDYSGYVVSKGMDPGEDGYSAFVARFDDGLTLHAHLQSLGVRGLFVLGLATDYCVLSSVLDALSLGYRVIVCVDACAAVNLKPDDGEYAFQQMRQAGAELAVLDL
jgi:nicotinamidase/pyrazinamidase